LTAYNTFVTELIINTLPWTNAQYQQLVGRLVRKGQIRDVVHVYLVKASIGGYQYDELKWKRIQFKRTLADCAVDGRLPEKNLVTPQQAAMEAVRWLERLERGEISTVVRRDLNVELTPVEIKKRVIKYGDFTRLNNKINNEKSETTHDRMLNDPREWEEYHRQYREARRNWAIVPYEEITKRIRQLSPRLIIGDFGCGEAKILESFGDNRVYSFDHIAINNKVKACDIKSVPLPDEADRDIIRVIDCELIDKGDPNQIVNLCWDIWQRSNYMNCVFFLDGSNRAMVNLLKIRWQESLSWESNESFDDTTRTRPVNFNTEHKNMLSNLHAVVSKQYLAIDPKYDKLLHYVQRMQRN
jgi:hypothetical protein